MLTNAVVNPHFNPRSREGSDRLPHRSLYRLLHFNPRSREGSDTCRHHRRIARKDFNPRSREGSDAVRVRLLQRDMISIHAPVKGATAPDLYAHQQTKYFNPRSREGSDPRRATHAAHSLAFQSTLP